MKKSKIKLAIKQSLEENELNPKNILGKKRNKIILDDDEEKEEEKNNNINEDKDKDKDIIEEVLNKGSRKR